METMQPQFSADILLVEDEANDAELILAGLKRRNIPGEVVHLTDGDQFVDSLFFASLYASWREVKIPKVILLDLKLKTVNGLEVLRLLKADGRACTIPVVVFTSSQREIELVESYKLGVNSYVIKPTDAGEFMRIVRRHRPLLAEGQSADDALTGVGFWDYFAGEYPRQSHANASGNVCCFTLWSVCPALRAKINW